MKAAEQDGPANTIVLRGRIGAEPQERALPSGDTLLTLRLVVAREPSPMTRASKQTSDWVDCSVWGGRVRATASTWHEGDFVEVRGALRRRYFRSAAGPSPGTRVEVEVLGGRVLKRGGSGDGRESRRAQSV
ncbi:MAG: single-stranded DNA-binding protein [Marmoricola sp.]|jgi:single-strand DNA-binding protein|nr:single-stranded DNA-binding protein [Marmoricola sp.]